MADEIAYLGTIEAIGGQRAEAAGDDSTAAEAPDAVHDEDETDESSGGDEPKGSAAKDEEE